MIVSALLLCVLAVLMCGALLRMIVGLLGLDLMQVLVWFGIAEVPPPPVSRRNRLAAVP